MIEGYVLNVWLQISSQVRPHSHSPHSSRTSHHHDVHSQCNLQREINGGRYYTRVTRLTALARLYASFYCHVDHAAMPIFSMP